MQLISFKNESITINTNSLARRTLFSIIILALATPPLYRSYCIFRADRIVRGEKSFNSYSRALQYDPSNGSLWWLRGRFSHYSVETLDLAQSISDYKKALSLNPRLGQAWVDLADCYERTGAYADAESALEKAFAVRTYSPVTRWQAGNYFLRRGNFEKMYESFKLASEYDGEKLPIAMELAWKADPNHAGILQKLIPNSLQANLRYLDFLISRDEVELARAAWERSLQCDPSAECDFKVSASFGYIDRLLARGRIPDAQRVWDEALQKAGTSLPERSYRKEFDKSQQSPKTANLVWNGSFENELLRGGFDWRYPDISGIQFQIDLSNRMEGLKSLKVTFAGSNIAFAHLSQIVPIPEAGNYVLDLYVRTEGLTTDQTPYITIQGYPDARGASQRTSMFIDSIPWRKITLPFTVAADCPAVQMVLRRDPSLKFDNQLKGSLWLDGVAIYPASDTDSQRTISRILAGEKKK